MFRSRQGRDRVRRGVRCLGVGPRTPASAAGVPECASGFPSVGVTDACCPPLAGSSLLHGGGNLAGNRLMIGEFF